MRSHVGSHALELRYKRRRITGCNWEFWDENLKVIGSFTKTLAKISERGPVYFQGGVNGSLVLPRRKTNGRMRPS